MRKSFRAIDEQLRVVALGSLRAGHVDVVAAPELDGVQGRLLFRRDFFFDPEHHGSVQTIFPTAIRAGSTCSQNQL